MGMGGGRNRRAGDRAGTGDVKLPLATVWPDGNFHTVNAKRYATKSKIATSCTVEIDVKSGGSAWLQGSRAAARRADVLVQMADI